MNTVYVTNVWDEELPVTRFGMQFIPGQRKKVSVSDQQLESLKRWEGILEVEELSEVVETQDKVQMIEDSGPEEEDTEQEPETNGTEPEKEDTESANIEQKEGES